MTPRLPHFAMTPPEAGFLVGVGSASVESGRPPWSHFGTDDLTPLAVVLAPCTASAVLDDLPWTFPLRTLDRDRPDRRTAHPGSAS